MVSFDRNYLYDIFVSYSAYDKEWVLSFYNDLVVEINRRSAHDIKPFLDRHRLDPGFVWNDALQAAAAGSAVFVPVLSERFFNSEYCQEEMRIFAEAQGLRSGADHLSRIVPIRLLCNAPPGHLLAKIQNQSFSETTDNIFEEFEHGTVDYKKALTRTAHAIIQILRVASSGSPRGAIYLASAGPDLKGKRDELSTALAQQYKVLPENPGHLLDMTPDEIRQCLAADLDRVFASVHPFGNLPTAIPPSATATLAELQLKAAVVSQKPRLIWHPGPSIDNARRDQLCNDGFQWFEQANALQEHIRRLWNKIDETKAVVTRSSGEHCIYFICPDWANKRKAEEFGLLAALRSHCGLVISPLEGDAGRALQYHIQALEGLDGCLIYYGDVDREWFDSIYCRVHKILRQRQMPRAVYLAPPPNDHKKNDLPYLGILILDPAGKTPDQAIEPFLHEFKTT